MRGLFSFCFSFTELQLEHVSKAFHITYLYPNILFAYPRDLFVYILLGAVAMRIRLLLPDVVLELSPLVGLAGVEQDEQENGETHGLNTNN